MDARALRAALVAAGVPDGIYAIAGVHEPSPPPPDFVFLRPAADGTGWETGVHERGRDTIAGTFEAEAEACRSLYDLLTG